jgi:ArsR family transcriptional regulator
MAKQTHVLTDEAIALVARRFAVLAEPMRLRLLHLLMAGELHVNALVAASGGTQANVSRHLQTLAEAGIVSRRKEGLQVFYGVADPTIFDLCELVCGSLEKQTAKQAALFSPPAKSRR